MGDPLFTPALVGAVVSITLAEVIDAAQGAIRIKESCKTLKVKVDKIVPLLEAAGDNSANWSKAELDWLKEFDTILSNARTVVDECLQESRCRKWKRLIKVWQWRKLPSRIKDINDQIDDARLNGILATRAGIQASNPTPKATESRADFVTQPVPPLIVGLGEEFTKLKTSILASHKNDKPSYIGLQGRGGAGKTTIARQLNNDKDIQATYGERGILWMTVGLDARIFDLYKTMGSFLNDGVFEEDYAHRNQEDQRSYLLNALAKKKVFIILDDVWEKPCDHKAMMYWLNIATAPGSTTLITTRITTVLSEVQAQTEVLSCLSNEDSWKLFCSHAFLSDAPPSNISEDLARKVCEECQGLPLALKVIGRTMLDKTTMAEWKRALSALQQSQPILDSNIDDELYHCLQLSYDELKNDTTKTCFLYCAAFPEDYKIQIEHLCQIWIGEGLFGALDDKDAEDEAMAHIEILIKRSMVDRSDDHIVVHDILRDLAMYIICTANPGDCAYKCCFQVKKVMKTIPDSKGMESVQRISFMQSTISKWPNSLEAPNLQVCILSQMSSSTTRLGIPTTFFSKLQALQYLDLSGNYFDFDQMLSSLQGLSALKILNLNECESLMELPESMCELDSLTKLYLNKCKCLKMLPKSMGGLKSLTLLHLGGCELLIELPESICELDSLTVLYLNGCKSLKMLPKSMGGLKSLTLLHLGGCELLIELPENICKLDSLTKLYLNECKSLQVLPKKMGGLKSLTLLSLPRCKSLIELPESICELDSLTVLYLNGCKSLKMLPKSMGGLKSLTLLHLGGCEFLIELPESICELDSLTELYLKECKSLKVLPKSMGGLKFLTLLHFGGCESLIELPESICELKYLTKLYFNGCISLKVLPKTMEGLKSLTLLHLGGCESLIELPEGICKLDSLIKLYLNECKSLQVLPKSMGGLKSLTLLGLPLCASLIELPESICELDSLTVLYLNGCKSLQVLPKKMGGLKSLTLLGLQRCELLIELPESICELDSLTELYLNDCKSLKVLPKSMEGLKSLRLLHLGGCESLIELPESICKLNSFLKLDLNGCTSLKVLPKCIGGLKFLTK